MIRAAIYFSFLVIKFLSNNIFKTSSHFQPIETYRDGFTRLPKSFPYLFYKITIPVSFVMALFVEQLSFNSQSTFFKELLSLTKQVRKNKGSVKRRAAFSLPSWPLTQHSLH